MSGEQPFTITSPSVSVDDYYMTVTDELKPSPSDMTLSIPCSDSNTKLLIPATPDDRTSQDSRDALLPGGGRKETGVTIALQVFGPFVVAGLGMVFAGLLLDTVKDWKVFKEVPELLVLVTPLLGLKGNLEATLASRLSTQANLGNFEEGNQVWAVCVANLCLVQVQALTLGFLASTVAIFIGVVLPGETETFTFRNALLLCSSSVITAAVASFILGILMIIVIFISKKLRINPDNISTPIAASLGDITTLGILACMAQFLFTRPGFPWVSIIIIIGFATTLPFWAYVAYKTQCTRSVLLEGWTPILSAMLISSMGGLILDKAEQKFAPLALYQPVINGVGGNLVSVAASRLSTHLHYQQGGVGGGSNSRQSPSSPLLSSTWATPWEVFTKGGIDSVASRVLLMLCIPGHIIFLTVTHLISSDSQDSAAFFFFYLLAATSQVAMLLYMAHILIHWLWSRNADPDVFAIPYLTSMGDLLGTGLLYLAFEAVHLV